MAGPEPRDAPPQEQGALPEPQDAPGVSPPADAPSPQPEDRLQSSRRWLTGAAAVAALVTGLLSVLGAGSSPVFRVLSALAAIVAFALFLWDAIAADLRQASRRRRLAYVAGTVVIAVVLVVAGLATRTATPLFRLPGTQDVAVVGFAAPSGEDQRLFDDVAASLAERLTDLVGEGAVHDYTTAVEDALVRGLGGPDAAERDARLSRFAGETNAEMVVGGSGAGRASGQVVLSVGVYVSPSFVADAGELAGWYSLDEILVDRSLSSTAARAALLDRITAGVGDITTFLTGLDAFQAGQPEEAVAAFDAMIAGADVGRGSLVDMAVLFRGHALEASALLAAAEERAALLEQARADYELIAESPAVAPRARLSLAMNEYLTVVGGACAPGSLGDDGLGSVAATLRSLSDDMSLAELTRLKASVNLAQVEYCRRVAGVTEDGSVLDALLAGLVATEYDGTGAEQQPRQRILAFAHSIAAASAATDGRAEDALAAIDQALALDGRVERQALWQGLRSGWLLRLCRVVEGEASQREALLQLREAVARGVAPESDIASYEAAFETDLVAARERCEEAGG